MKSALMPVLPEGEQRRTSTEMGRDRYAHPPLHPENHTRHDLPVCARQGSRMHSHDLHPRPHTGLTLSHGGASLQELAGDLYGHSDKGDAHVASGAHEVWDLSGPL